MRSQECDEIGVSFADARQNFQLLVEELESRFVTSA